MKNGIDRRNMIAEINDLQNVQLVTMTKKEARAAIDELAGSSEELETALDYAQGDDQAGCRYVVIYVTE